MSCILFARHPRAGGDPATLLFESGKALDDQRCVLSWSDPRLRGDDDFICVERLA